MRRGIHLTRLALQKRKTPSGAPMDAPVEKYPERSARLACNRRHQISVARQYVRPTSCAAGSATQMQQVGAANIYVGLLIVVIMAPHPATSSKHCLPNCVFSSEVQQQQKQQQKQQGKSTHPSSSHAHHVIVHGMACSVNRHELFESLCTKWYLPSKLPSAKPFDDIPELKVGDVAALPRTASSATACRKPREGGELLATQQYGRG